MCLDMMTSEVPLGNISNFLDICGGDNSIPLCPITPRSFGACLKSEARLENCDSDSFENSNLTIPKSRHGAGAAVLVRVGFLGTVDVWGWIIFGGVGGLSCPL